MPKSDNFEVDGLVVEALPGAKFKVRLANGHIIMCTISGKIRMHNIKIMQGDSVKVAMSPYDFEHGFITYRNKVSS